MGVLLKQSKFVFISVSLNRNLPDAKEQNNHPKKTKTGNKPKFYTCHTFPFRVGVDLFPRCSSGTVELYHTRAHELTEQSPSPMGQQAVDTGMGQARLARWREIRKGWFPRV